MAKPTTPADIAAHIRTKPGFVAAWPVFVATANTPNHRFYAPEVRLFESFGLVSNVTEFADNHSLDTLASGSVTELGLAVAALLAA